MADRNAVDRTFRRRRLLVRDAAPIVVFVTLLVGLNGFIAPPTN